MRDVFAEIVDYAGLFPPATCTMAEAVRNYSGYRDSADRWMLGSFVVAAARLEELSQALRAVDLTPVDPWRLSVVMGVNVLAEVEWIEEFQAAWDGRGVLVDAIECKAASAGQVLAINGQIPTSLRRHFEVPIEGPYRPLIEAIASVEGSAKVRTGGTSPELFPLPEQLTRFLLAVTHRGVAFKATAGLHHPIRGEYPLTYAPDAVHHVMYGFVNLLLATTELARGGDGETAQALLEDADPGHFSREPAGIRWRDNHYGLEDLASVRHKFFLGFGSCSFREPVDELRRGGLA